MKKFNSTITIFILSIIATSSVILPQNRLRANTALIKQVDSQSLEPISTKNVDQLREQASWVYSTDAIAFSPDGTQLALSRGSSIYIQDVVTGKRVQTLVGHNSRVTSLEFSSDGKSLASSSYEDGKSNLWRVETGELIKTVAGIEATFTLDGMSLVVVAKNGSIEVLNVETGKIFRRMGGDEATSVAVSPDGNHILTGHLSNISIWSLQDGKEIDKLKLGYTWMDSLVFSSDGRFLATTGSAYPSPVILLDAQSGNVKAELEGHSGIVIDLAFNPDGTLLSSASWDNTIRIWDTLKETQLEILTPKIGRLNDLAFSVDGKLLAAAGDKGVKIWGVPITSAETPRSGVTVKAFASGDTSLKPEDYEKLIPKAWVTSNDKQPQYEIEINVRGVIVETCRYGAGGVYRVLRIRDDVTVTITNLETKEDVAKSTFSGGQPDACKSNETFNTYSTVNYYYGKAPDISTIKTWLLEVMNKYNFTA